MVTKVGVRPVPATVGVGLVARDKLGTGEASRAVLKMSDRWLVRIDEETDVEITSRALGAKDKEALKVALGGAFVFSREEEGEVKLQTPSATGGLRGTQLVVRVFPDGRTVMQVIEGEVDLANERGRVLLKAGEAGEAEIGRTPRKTAMIAASNLLQWALYYPVVLQIEELGLSPGERGALAESLEAYRQGDLLGALERFPPGFAPASEGARLYRAAVLLATGRVEGARQAIGDVPAGHPGRRAVERMLAAVLNREQPAWAAGSTAGEALAESYFQQSRGDLEAARAAARRATALAPESGFAWTRLAELEFSFGRIRETETALTRGLRFTPRHAQAHALRGFALSAENRLAAAQAAFEEAVRLDGGLGNAWLGLGLTKIKRGRRAEGRADLQLAATVEPTRSLFYSYHGKALSQEGRGELARKDLALARQLDPQDPTPWLYSAIHDQQENRANAAIRELQESQRLNDNRRVYRSQFLLDQDRAVRSANLAKVYQNAGLTDLAVREATRGVEGDYTNASAHRFLANSFAALRDPRRQNLRYETAWGNEQLLADLLAPVGGGPLSQFVSQQEYSKLLEADGLGGSVVTEWHDDGYRDWQASLFGTFGRASGGIDFLYNKDNGTRPNNDSRRKELYGQFKYQLTPDDVLYTLGKWQQQVGGDLAQRSSNEPGNLGLRFEDKQAPGLLLVGWNHRWAPGVHTLFLGGRLGGRQTVTAPKATLWVLERDSRILYPGLLQDGSAGAVEFTSVALRHAVVPPVSSNPDGSLKVSADLQRELAPFLGHGPVINALPVNFDFTTQTDLGIASGELQHIWQTRRHTLLLGGRWQGGAFETKTRVDVLAASNVPFFTSPAARQQVSVDFARRSLYAYDFIQVTPWLTLIAGGAWDRIERPENFRNPPVSDQQVATEQTSSKFGFTLTPARSVTIRGAYTEAMGGVSFDESVRLEPVQFAGFNQAFRSVISESITGSVEVPAYKNWGLSAEGALPSQTWWSVSFDLLQEDVERTVGVFDALTAPVFLPGFVILPASTENRFAYRERIFTAGINQLLGHEFAVGAGYRRTRAELRTLFPQIPTAILASADGWEEGTLNEFSVHANWNSPTGWFARAEGNWYAQALAATAAGRYVASPSGDRFWQFHARLGFRFHRNLREISGGVLNLNDRDYHLSPLTFTRELPRTRTFVFSARVSF